jgi:hypothetical protein
MDHHKKTPCGAFGMLSKCFASKQIAQLRKGVSDDNQDKYNFLSIDTKFQGSLSEDVWSDFASDYSTYFQLLEDENLNNTFDRDLQKLWFSALKEEMQQICISPKRKFHHLAADLPKPRDLNYIPFSSFRYLLFVFDFFCTFELNTGNINNAIKSSISKGANSFTLWRLLWFFARQSSSTPRSSSPYFNDSDPFSVLTSSCIDKTSLEKNIRDFLRKPKMFPLEFRYAVNEEVMRFLRVLYWVIEKARDQLSCSAPAQHVLIEIMELNSPVNRLFSLYGLIAKESCFDRLIVKHVDLQYESILKQKRQIEESEEGAAFAIKVPKLMSYEIELDSVDWRLSTWKTRRESVMKKIHEVKHDLCSATYMSSSRSSALYLRLQKKQDILSMVDKKLRELNEKKRFLQIKYNM